MELLSIIGHVSNMAGALGGIFAAIGVAKLLATKKREAARIEVRLVISEGESISLPLEMLRRDVSRSELLGRIGMLPMRQKGARFALRALSTSEFMRALNQVVEGKTSIINIPATREELEQFELKN